MEQERKKYDAMVHLHTHSTFSFIDGVGLPSEYAKKASELGQPALGVTDHGNISSHFKWYTECKKNSIKPILGVEFYIVDDEIFLKEREYNHITVLAKNNEGYLNLTKLVTKSWCEQFYYKPRITFKDLSDNSEGLIIMSGCISGSISKMIINKADSKSIIEKIYKYRSSFKDFYIEISPLSFDIGKDTIGKLIELSEITDTPLVATADCHYINKEQAYLQEIMLCVQSNDKMSNPNRWKFDQHGFYVKSREEMEQSFKEIFPEFDCSEALDNTVKIANMVDFEFPKAHPLKFNIEENKKFHTLKEMAWKGLKEKGFGKNKEYIERARYELDLIQKKDFVDYFLIIQDLVGWSKRNDILVGPARGSSAGSLVCYLIGITEVDPIRHGLIFERFIDLNRTDLPDIDVDFEDRRRDDIKRYLEKTYGENKVGTLATFSTYKGKVCVDDIGRVFEIPFAVVDKIKSLLLERSGGDSRSSLTVGDTLFGKDFAYPKEALKEYPNLKYAADLEGQIRNISSHASGIVVSNEPLTDFCAVYKLRDSHTISLDYYDALGVGLMKIDILGLNTLTAISKTLELIKERHDKTIDLYKLPLDDKKTYEGFKKEKLFGIFQFDGQAVNQVCRQISPTTFEEMSTINALARPGSLNSGATTLFIIRKNGLEPVKYFHKLLEPITKETFGIFIYQEQIMRVLREVGKMSWEDTSAIRKTISRSMGVEYFNSFKDRFIPGCKENGLTDDEINTVWENMITFGSWSFNKSHSVSYSIISYWTMYLKMHYPLEFYSSLVSTAHNETKIGKVLKEFKREGGKLLGPDINKSKRNFSIDGNSIRIGFSNIKGIGEKAAQAIEENQPYISFNNFSEKLKGKKVTASVKQKLVDIGAFDGLINTTGQMNLIGETKQEVTKNELTFAEIFSLSPYLVDLKLSDTWKNFLRKSIKHDITSIEDLKNMPSEYATIIGIVYDKNLRDKLEVSASKGKKITMKEGEPTAFCNFTMEDDNDFVTIRLSTRVYPKYGKVVFEDMKDGDVMMIYGRMGSGIRMFFGNKVVNLSRLREKIESNKALSADERYFTYE